MEDKALQNYTCPSDYILADLLFERLHIGLGVCDSLLQSAHALRQDLISRGEVLAFTLEYVVRRFQLRVLLLQLLCVVA